MTIPELQELRNEAYDKMEAVYENSEGDFSEAEETEYESAKAEVDKLDKKMARAKEVEQMKAKKAFAKHDKEKSNEGNKFNFLEALNFMRKPDSVSAEKQEFYSQVNKEATEAARKSGANLQGGGFVISPSTFSNAVDVTTEGEDLVFDQEGEFIQALRDRMALSELGTRYLSGLSGDVRMPKLTSTSNFTWEQETAEGTATDTSYGQVKLSPSRGFSSVNVSNQLLAQSSPSIESLIRDDIMKSVARGVQNAAINGAGPNGPTGILDVATLVSGDDLYDTVIDLETEVMGKNVMGDFAYLLDTKAYGIANKTVKEAGEARYVWESATRTINGYQTGVTNAVLDNHLIFGDFSNLIIGDFAGMEIVADPFTRANFGETKYTINVYMGTAIRHDEAFAYADLTPSGT